MRHRAGTPDPSGAGRGRTLARLAAALGEDPTALILAKANVWMITLINSEKWVEYYMAAITPRFIHGPSEPQAPQG